MSKNLRKTTLLICFIVIVSMLSACGGNQAAELVKSTDSTQITSEKVVKEITSIEWSCWGNPGENKKFEDLTAAFNEKHADSINIKYSPIPSDGYTQKMLSSLAAGIAPDIFYISPGDIVTYTKEDRLIDLKPMMEASVTVKPDAFALNIFGAAIQGDKIFGIVPDCNPLVIYYNTDMIKSVGEKTPQEYLDEGKWNWDAFASIAKKISTTGKKGFVFNPAGSQAAVFLGQGGEGLYYNAEGTKVDLDNPEKAEGVKFFYELSQAKAITAQVQLPKGQDPTALFVSNQAAMITSGRWVVPVFKDIKDFSWDIVPYPTTNSGKEVKSSVAISYIAMNADTKHQEEAFTFMEEFLNKDGQIYRLADGGNALSSLVDPSLGNIAEDGIVGHAKYFIELRNSGLGTPKGAQASPEATAAVFDTFNQMFLGKINADICIRQAAEKANPILDAANK